MCVTCGNSREQYPDVLSAAAMYRQTLTITAFAAYSNNKELRKLSGLFETSKTWTATKLLNFGMEEIWKFI